MDYYGYDICILRLLIMPNCKKILIIAFKKIMKSPGPAHLSIVLSMPG